MPTNDDTQTIESILTDFATEAVAICSDGYARYKRQDGWDDFDLNEKQAKAAIQNLIDRARIDELVYWQWKTDGHIELSAQDVANRIKTLKAKIKERE